MKGLIIRNIYSIYRKNEKLIIMMLLVNALFMTMFSSFSFLSIFTMLFAAALVQDQIYDDTKTGYLDFESSLPFTSKDIVLSRYISSVAFIFIGATASIVSTSFVIFMFDYDLPYLPFALSTLLFAYIAFVLLCVLFPLYYRYSTKHIRLISIALLVIPTGLNFLATRTEVGKLLSISLPIYLIVILAVLSLVIITGSIYISLNLMKKMKFE